MVQKFECNFVKCLNPMCSAVVYTGCISYKKVPIVTNLRTLKIHISNTYCFFFKKIE